MPTDPPRRRPRALPAHRAGRVRHDRRGGGGRQLRPRIEEARPATSSSSTRAPTTIQDLGRFGAARRRPALGAHGSRRLRDREPAGRQSRRRGRARMHHQGAAARVRQAAVVAVAGAPDGLHGERSGSARVAGPAVRVRPGDVLGSRWRARGAGRLAVAGGIDVPPVLGSRATYLRAGSAASAAGSSRRATRCPSGPPPRARNGRAGRFRAARRPPPPSGSAASSSGRRTIASPRGHPGVPRGPLRRHPQADRMGYRLHGPEIPARARPRHRVGRHPAGRHPGPGERQPIVLLVDRQTTGGYTKIATVIGVDIGAIGQTRPGADPVPPREPRGGPRRARRGGRWLAQAIEG